jgi:hypothetical protein
MNHARERLHEAYVAWLPTSSTTLKGGLEYERFRRSLEQTFITDPFEVESVILPLTIYHSFPGPAFGRVSFTHVRHEVSRPPQSPLAFGKDNFSVVDLALGARLPQRRGFVRLEVRNAFDQKFSFYDINFFSPEPRNPRFIPTRVILLSFAATL